MREKREEETGDPKEIGQCRSKFYSVSTKLEEEGAVKKKRKKEKVLQQSKERGWT